MPRGDGTGPAGGGGGRGLGQGGGTGAGVGGNCVCPQCGKVVAHQQGQQCYKMTCPKCGAKMTRQ